MYKNLFCLIFLFSYLFPLMANTPGDYNEEIKKYTSNLPFEMGEIKAPVFRDKSFNIRDFGAIPDGHTLNTDPINNAITKCSEDGGGMVIIPDRKSTRLNSSHLGISYAVFCLKKK